jgi:hypothetical protein
MWVLAYGILTCLCSNYESNMQWSLDEYFILVLQIWHFGCNSDPETSNKCCVWHGALHPARVIIQHHKFKGLEVLSLSDRNFYLFCSIDVVWVFGIAFNAHVNLKIADLGFYFFWHIPKTWYGRRTSTNHTSQVPHAEHPWIFLPVVQCQIKPSIVSVAVKSQQTKTPVASTALWVHCQLCLGIRGVGSEQHTASLPAGGAVEQGCVPQDEADAWGRTSLSLPHSGHHLGWLRQQSVSRHMSDFFIDAVTCCTLHNHVIRMSAFYPNVYVLIGYFDECTCPLGWAGWPAEGTQRPRLRLLSYAVNLSHKVTS